MQKHDKLDIVKLKPFVLQKTPLGKCKDKSQGKNKCLCLYPTKKFSLNQSEIQPGYKDLNSPPFKLCC